MNRLLSNLLTVLLLSPLAVAQAPGHSPTRDLEYTDEGAAQLDKIGVMVDRELEFRDERDYPFQLKQMFPGKQPVVLMLGYYSCPAMCGQVLEAALFALNGTDLQPGTDYRMLSVSINPDETPEIAANRKGAFLTKLLKTGGDDAWHLLVGSEANSRALADSVGFQYYWSEATQQFAHPPSLMRIGGAITVIVLAAMIWIMLRRERRKAQSETSTSPETGIANPAPSQVG